MTTTPKETHMPTDPNHRALLRAVEKLTTQVRRIADTLETPAVTDDDGAQTTADDTRPLILRTISHWEPVCESGRHPAHALQTCAEIDAFTTFLQNRMQQQSAADWKATAAVYSGLHSTAENEVKQTRAELAEARAAIERVRAIRPSPPRSEFNARTNAQDEGWDQAVATVRAALLGPIAEAF